MVDRTLFKVSHRVVNYAQVNVGEELAGDVGDLLVLGVEVDRLLVVGGLGLAQLHEIDTDAVISKGFSVDVTDSLAHLEELLILLDRVLKLAEVIVEHSSRVVSTAFVTGFASALASKCQHVVVLQALLSAKAVV
jgi:hypothetical protein